MTNVYSDLLKLNAKKQPKVDAINTGLQTQASLAKMRYDVGAGVPTAQDDASNTFGAMRKQLGDGPQHGWRAAISGLLGGLELGSKSAANNERREQGNKMAETFSYLEGIANEANKRRTMHEKQQGLQAQITPELEALTKNMKMLPYDDVVKAGSGIVDRLNQSNGTNYKISMIDQQNGKVLLTESGKPDQKVDLFEMFPKIREEQNIDYLTKKAIETQEFKNKLSMKNVDIAQQNADTYVKTANTSARNTDLKNIAAIDKIVGGKISAKQEFLRDAPRLRAIVESDPEMMQSLAQIQWANETPGYIETQIRKLSTALNPQRAKNLGIAAKMINKMQLDVTKGFTRPNMFIEKKGAQSVPNFNMTADALVSVLNTMEEDYKSDVSDYNAMAKAIDSTADHAYTDALTNPHQATISPENPLPLTPEEQQAAGKAQVPQKQQAQTTEDEPRIPVLNSQGIPGTVPISKLKEKLANGYTLK